MRFAVFARVVSVFAVLLCWPVFALAALVKPRRERSWPNWRWSVWSKAFNAWYDHHRDGHCIRAALWGALTDRIAA